MRSLILLALAAALASPTAAQTPERSLRAAFEAGQGSRIFTVAHRSCWRAASENSIAGIEACAKLGIDLVEIDVQLTRDGVPVLMHDRDVARMTGGVGKIADMSLSDLKKFRLRKGAGGLGAAMTDASIPTLAEALAAARGKVITHLDLKRGPEDWSAVWKVVEAERATDVVLMKITEPAADPAWKAAPFTGKTLVRSRVGQDSYPDLGAGLCALEGRGLAAHTVMFKSLDYIASLKAARARCHDGRLWVATESPDYAGGLDDALALKDPDAVWGRLIDAGFTVLETDHPEALKAYLQRRAAR